MSIKVTGVTGSLKYDTSKDNPIRFQSNKELITLGDIRLGKDGNIYIEKLSVNGREYCEIGIYKKIENIKNGDLITYNLKPSFSIKYQSAGVPVFNDRQPMIILESKNKLDIKFIKKELTNFI